MNVRVRNLLTTVDLGKITMPTLVLWSAENPFGAVPEAQAMHAAIPGSRLEIFGECGHWPQFEQAGKYNALSLEFLAAAARSALTRR
jgi:2-hydroxy-6-oxonona-2,4-dienedioate hydrolase